MITTLEVRAEVLLPIVIYSSGARNGIKSDESNFKSSEGARKTLCT
jgi:hypothetical protein